MTFLFSGSKTNFNFFFFSHKAKISWFNMLGSVCGENNLQANNKSWFTAMGAPTKNSSHCGGVFLYHTIMFNGIVKNFALEANNLY